jgi:hypothetical protein
MELQAKTQSNPLAMFMRQPKIYIRLPSGGNFWPAGSLELTDTGDFPVYSMTARDELILKVPDALMNGQAVVDVIQNCMPNIKNAWHVPSIDLDLILIAIRLATYGEMMTTPVKFSEEFEMDYKVDLRTVMDSLLSQINWEEAVPVNDQLTVFVKPLNYKQMTESAIKTFETQKLMQVVNNDDITEADKITLFKESFVKLSNATLGAISNSISRIESSNGGTEDPQHISDFVENVDKEIYNIINLHLERMSKQNSIKPVIIKVTDEMKENGVKGDTVEIPLTFDPATFFV